MTHCKIRFLIPIRVATPSALVHQQVYNTIMSAKFKNCGHNEHQIWLAYSNWQAKSNIPGPFLSNAISSLFPGLCSLVGGRPKPSPSLKLFSFLYPKSQLPATVSLDDQVQSYNAQIFESSAIEPEQVSQVPLLKTSYFWKTCHQCIKRLAKLYS